MSEPQRDQRKTVDLGVSADFEDHFYFARVVDVSKRGFQVMMYRHFEKGSQISFLIEKDDKRFKCIGQIMWVKRHSIFPRRSWRFGVRIVGNVFPQEFLALLEQSASGE